jgi:prepilin-type N-terminal cleavage/methylation domain-containing protein
MVSHQGVGSAYKSGFTLVEISIVMMILSLMVALTLSGKGLVDSAFIRSITREKSKYELLITSFNDIYGFMPGSDMSYQRSFKVKNTPQSQLFYDSASVIQNQSVVDYINNPYQIMNASILLRKYDPSLNTLNSSSSGISIPNYKAIPYSTISKFIITSSSKNPSGWIFGSNLNNPMDPSFLVLTGLNNSTSTFSWNGIPSMSVKNARNMDKKFDDGMPMTGNIRSYASFGKTNCTMPSPSCINGYGGCLNCCVYITLYNNKKTDTIVDGCVMSYKLAI